MQDFILLFAFMSVNSIIVDFAKLDLSNASKVIPLCVEIHLKREYKSHRTSFGLSRNMVPA